MELIGNKLFEDEDDDEDENDYDGAAPPLLAPSS